MHYEINVTKNGHHYFATHPRSLNNSNTISEIAADFRKRFPIEEGFKVDVYRVEEGRFKENW